MPERQYVHGYDALESERLQQQAELLRELVHDDTIIPNGSLVLEIGCGTGAQTVFLARNNPGARVVAVDRSAVSLATARIAARDAGLTNVELHEADVTALPFGANQFDHVFGSFILEHVQQPLSALVSVARVMKWAASITVIEGDHGSVLMHPPSDTALRAVASQTELQRRTGGEPNIGRRLYPLLVDAGFDEVRVVPHVMYVDGSRRDRIAAVERTFVAMIAGVRDDAIAAGIIDGEVFDAGIADLRHAIRAGVFSYTFFKAIACKKARRR